MISEERKKGLDTYWRLLGEEKKEFNELDTFTIDHLFAKIWSREDFLSLTDRSKITISILAALGKDSELKRHLDGAKNLGISRDEIVEIMIHVAHYAGWPAGHHALDMLHKWETGEGNYIA